ncbi:glutamate-1-semialdehyde aminotransferase [Sporolactobacillus inulinus]|uniref:Glutamate-1-semialdehyde aminotransferase n=1 Tax=Sporolactobacillus inulinus TaxID=2078 RepID=A0A4Y1Z7V8_9BACL|nr:glutamate-1-semialdehyde aminotransferase [Sporolactobacillus inulinus]
MNFSKSIAAYEEAKPLMPGGVSSPVRSFPSVDLSPILWIMGKLRRSMMLMEMNILITC